MTDKDEIEFGDDFFSVLIGIIVFLIILAVDIMLIAFEILFALCAVCFEIGFAILGLGGDD